MTAAVTHCRTCGAFAPPAGVCPVCQQFDPPLKRSVLVGAALFGLVAAGLATAAWAAVVSEKWERWLRLFGRSGDPPELADARSMAVAVGLLVFAVAGVAGTAVVAWVGRR